MKITRTKWQQNNTSVEQDTGVHICTQQVPVRSCCTDQSTDKTPTVGVNSVLPSSSEGQTPSNLQFFFLNIKNYLFYKKTHQCFHWEINHSTGRAVVWLVFSATRDTTKWEETETHGQGGTESDLLLSCVTFKLQTVCLCCYTCREMVHRQSFYNLYLINLLNPTTLLCVHVFKQDTDQLSAAELICVCSPSAVFWCLWSFLCLLLLLVSSFYSLWSLTAVSAPLHRDRNSKSNIQQHLQWWRTQSTRVQHFITSALSFTNKREHYWM